MEKYQLLKDEIIKMLGGGGVKKVIIVPVVIGVLGVVSKNFEKYVKKLEIEVPGNLQNRSKHYHVYPG